VQAGDAGQSCGKDVGVKMLSQFTPDTDAYAIVSPETLH